MEVSHLINSLLLLRSALRKRQYPVPLSTCSPSYTQQLVAFCVSNCWWKSVRMNGEISQAFIFMVCRMFDHKHFFIQTPVEHVILCVGGNLLAFTVSTSYNQIFIQAKRVNVKVVLILYFTGGCNWNRQLLSDKTWSLFLFVSQVSISSVSESLFAAA